MTLQQKTPTATPAATLSRLLAHEDDHSRKDERRAQPHTLSPSQSPMFILTPGPHSSAQDSPQATSPGPAFSQSERERAGQKMGGRQGVEDGTCTFT